MLILSRKSEESIVIGENIVIKVISIDKGSVRLGFEAPPQMLILRSELKEAVVNQNQQAIVLPNLSQLEDISKHLKK
ncbi:carbon storage regulator [Helicobacter enhydrae]|uniref:Translational regulator CsrA n=1 Tax=Helicobacter enhydrae TaxID=222136 RepID=A0A1B1U4E7_9HELI|nr:carbon storage regulator [Helicobacter enhydrae]ANV97633.1 carbon storage regulator [Helicobacter enhydrae]